MPGLFTGFLKGFNDATTASRAEAARQADAQMARDQATLHDIATTSDDPHVAAQAVQGLIAMHRGQYDPKSGFGKFFGQRATPAPGLVSLLSTLKGAGGPGSPAGAAPEGATATQPTTTLGESPTGTAAVTSGEAGGAAPPPAPTGGEEQLPTAGLSALPGGANSALTGTGPGSRSAVAPVAGQGTAPPITSTPIQPVSGATTPLSAPPIAPSPGPKPPAGVPPPPTPTSLGMPSLTRPTLAPGQIRFTPSQTADLAAWRQAQLPAAEQEARYQLGYQDAISAGMAPTQAHAEGLRRAGVSPILNTARPNVIGMGDDGLLHSFLTSFDPVSGQYTQVQGPVYMGTTAGNPNDIERVAQEMGFIKAGMPAGMGWSMMTPQQKTAAQAELYRRQTEQAGAVAGARGAAAPYTMTAPDLSTQRVFPGVPPPALSGGGGTTPPATPPPPITAPGGGGAPTSAAKPPVSAPPPTTTTAPKVGTQVGSNPGHPEAPVLNPPATPDAAAAVSGGTPPQTTAGAPAGSRVVQTGPPVAIDVEGASGVGAATGARYLDTSQFTGKPKELAVSEAVSKGIRPLTAAQVASLGEFQKARQSILTYTKQILPYLASTPGGRVKTTFNNWLNELAQTNPTLAALQSEWTTAIDTLRGPNMRITFPEIAKSLTGLPEPSDTIDTAVQKLQNITGMFDRAENAVLPPPSEVINAVRTGQLPPDHAWTIQHGPGAGQEWAYKGSTGALYRIK